MIDTIYLSLFLIHIYIYIYILIYFFFISYLKLKTRWLKKKTLDTHHLKAIQETIGGLFTAGWFGVREKHCSWLEIYDRLRPSEQADELLNRVTTSSII